MWERLIDREKENYLKKGRADANQRAYFEGTISWVYTGFKRGWDKGSHTIKLSYQLCINLLLSSLHCAFKLQRLPRCSCNLLLFLFSETNNQLQTNWEFSWFQFTWWSWERLTEERHTSYIWSYRRRQRSCSTRRRWAFHICPGSVRTFCRHSVICWKRESNPWCGRGIHIDIDIYTKLVKLTWRREIPNGSKYI